MKLRFTLNGRSIEAETSTSTRLADFLRRELQLQSLHPSCYDGQCGNCAILLDGELVYSCLLPGFAVQGRSITTYEGIIDTLDYNDIISGFHDEQAHPCTYCLPAKVVITQSILESTLDPSQQEVLEVFSGTYCPCTNFHNLARGVVRAGKYRRRRLHER